MPLVLGQRHAGTEGEKQYDEQQEEHFIAIHRWNTPTWGMRFTIVAVGAAESRRTAAPIITASPAGGYVNRTHRGP